MPDSQKPYTLMLNAVADALEDLQKMTHGAAQDRLLHAQLQAEGLYISQGGTHDEGGG